MRKIITGDQVVVIAGGDKGKTGKVLSVRDNKVVVEGVNVSKKFVRKNVLGKNTEGSIVELERPIQISNVALVAENGKPAKVSFEMVDGKRVRKISVKNVFKNVVAEKAPKVEKAAKAAKTEKKAVAPKKKKTTKLAKKDENA